MDLRRKSRLTLEISQSTRDLMETLKERTEAGSITEVIRRAIAIYDRVSSEGSCIFVRTKDGKEKELLVL